MQADVAQLPQHAGKQHHRRQDRRALAPFALARQGTDDGLAPSGSDMTVASKAKGSAAGRTGEFTDMETHS